METATPKTRTTIGERCAAFFSYFPLFLPFGGLTLLVLNKTNLTVRFAAMQSIVIWPFYIIVNFFISQVPVFGFLFTLMAQLALIVLSIVVLFGVKPRLPWAATVSDNTLARLSESRATFFHRFLAFYINGFITFVAAGLGSLLTWFIAGAFGGTQEVQLNAVTVAFLVVVTVVWIINLIMMIRFGDDLGKRFLHLKVRTHDGEPVSGGAVILREVVGKMLSGFLVLGYLWVLIDKDRQSWHDKLAKTVVFYEGR